MKKATKQVFAFFPNLEQYLSHHERTLYADDALSSLNVVEQTFLKLAWFFENPEKENFNLECLYKHLENEWLEFALEVINTFFKKDTYLIKHPTTSFVTERDIYLNQSQFADFLTKHDVPFTRHKLNTYLSRGVFPDPDIVVSGVKYWHQQTCKQYLETLDKQSSSQ